MGCGKGVLVTKGFFLNFEEGSWLECMSLSHFWLLGCSRSLIWVYLADFAGDHVNIVVYNLFYRGQLADSPIKMPTALLQEQQTIPCRLFGQYS